MYGTHDHPDETPRSIVNDTWTITHAVTLVKLVSQAVHFHASNFLNTFVNQVANGCFIKIPVPSYRVRPGFSSVLE